jgi:hypothetical protein
MRRWGADYHGDEISSIASQVGRLHFKRYIVASQSPQNAAKPESVIRFVRFIFVLAQDQPVFGRARMEVLIE